MADHPFHSDDSAQHHWLDGAWLWMLRFNNGVTSAGFVLDNSRYPAHPELPAEREWQSWLQQYPSLARMFATAELAVKPGAVLASSRLQRRAATIVGRDWALLPHAAGFVDPLHSTGIAHTLCGIERLARLFADGWQTPQFAAGLRKYEAAVQAELSLIDQLVAGCYRANSDFRLLTAYAMLYFAAATSYERRRLEFRDGDRQYFLCADDPSFRSAVATVESQLADLPSRPTDEQIATFTALVAGILAPFNQVGLCDPAAQNMYRYTMPPEV